MRAAAPLPAESRRAAGTDLLFRALLVPARADQYASQAVIPLVTCGVEDHLALIAGLAHLNDNGPRLGPGLRIVERNLAPQLVRRWARDAFDHLIRVDVRSTKALREIGGFDDQRVSFPVAA